MHIRYLLLLFLSFQPLHSAHQSDADIKKRWAALTVEIDETSRLATAPFNAATTTQSSLAKPVLKRANATAGSMAGTKKEFEFTLKRSATTAGGLAKKAVAHAQYSSAAGAASPHSPATPLLHSPIISAATPAPPAPLETQTKEDAQSCTVASIRKKIADKGLCYWILNPNSSDTTIPDLEAIVARDTAPSGQMRKVDLGTVFSLLSATEKEDWLKLTAHRRYTFWTYNNGSKNLRQHTVFPIIQHTPSTIATLAIMRF